MVKAGDTVKTKFGEELEVLDTRQTPVKRQGKVIGEQTMFLAQSGDHKVWLPESYIAEEAE